MNGRRRTLAALAALLVGRAGQAQAAPRRIGWLSYLSAPDLAADLLRDGMRELGHVEGRSYVIVGRYADGDFSRLPRLVEELLAEHLDVLVSRGPSVDHAVAARTRLPVVFAYSGDPVEAGFADSLPRPGRNMTGITFMAMELSAKRVEVLKELVPKAVRIALLSNPEHSGELREYRVTEDTAARLRASISRFVVRSAQDLPAVYEAIRASRPDAMIVFPDSFTYSRRAEIAAFAAQAGIATMYGWSEFVEAGGLASYGPGLNENFKRLAVFVDKILKGSEASTLPIEQVRKIGLTFNPGAAQALGLAVPPAILLRADHIVR